MQLTPKKHVTNICTQRLNKYVYSSSSSERTYVLFQEEGGPNFTLPVNAAVNVDCDRNGFQNN